MNRKDKYMILATSIACLLPLVLSFALYERLPEQMAVHWDSAGNADGHLPKAAAAFGLPALMMLINLFSKIRLLGDPKRAAHSQIMAALSLWLVPALSLIFVPVTLFIAMGAIYPFRTSCLCSSGY